MKSSTLTALVFASPIFASVLPAASPLRTRQTLAGYQTQCVTQDTSIAFDDGPHIYETELVDAMASYGAKGTLFVNGYNYVNSPLLTNHTRKN